MLPASQSAGFRSRISSLSTARDDAFLHSCVQVSVNEEENAGDGIMTFSAVSVKEQLGTDAAVIKHRQTAVLIEVAAAAGSCV